jgi:uncharacterized repeat protein (TIGR01451 family)
MKQLYRLIMVVWVLISGFNSAKAQLMPIPDANFRAYLQNAGFSGCLTGTLLDTSCPLVINASKINTSGFSISSFEGLQYFYNIDTLIITGSNISYMPNLPVSIEHLAITYSQLNSIGDFPFNLNYLALNNNQLEFIPEIPNSVTTLDLSNNYLTSIPNLPSSLIKFYANYNELTQIPLLPNSVTEILIKGNELDSLPNFPNSLYSIDCSSNNLVSIPSLPVSLGSLKCNYNELTSLPSFDQSPVLHHVECTNNLIDTLVSLPPDIWTFYCGNNLLTNLPNPSTGIRYLSFSNNFLDSLPFIANCGAMITLSCTDNPMAYQIPGPLPLGLRNLYCSGCNLDSLPALPSQLSELNCSNNNLEQLPLLPYTLTSLNCSFNNLSSLPPLNLPFSFSKLLINDNPNIYCLPPFERFNGPSLDFNINNTGISCLPNYFSHPQGINFIDDIPLCGIFGNPDGCEIAWNVAGRVHLESTGDCIQQNQEPNLTNVKMQLVQGGVPTQQVYVNTSGFYSFNTELDEYEIKVDTTDFPFDLVCPVNNSYITNPGGNDTLDFLGNFAAQCRSGYDLEAHSLTHHSGLFFPTNSANMRLKAFDLANYYGVTCNTNGLSGRLKLWIDGPASFGTYPTSSFLLSDTLNIVVDDFSTISNLSWFPFSVVTDTFPPMGSSVCIHVKIETDAVSMDVNPNNDTLMMCYEVINSYDPNYKEVYPSTVSESGLWHTYTAHFQNTGTAPAQNILLKDTLSSNLDWSSFSRLDASHNNYTQVLENGIVHFYFPEIFLPDSTSDEPNSHGWVQFKIKTKSSLNSYTVIPNTVSIYFDYNDPVVTNSADLTLCFPETAVQSLTICPHDSIKVGNDWYTAAGNYSNLLNTIHGCDSLVSTSLNHFPAIFNEQSYSLCYGNSIDLNGITYSETGSYQTFYITTAGCDSIVTVNIQVEPLIAGSQTISICQGDSIVSAGVVYKEPSTFTMNFLSHGCDSLVTTTLLVNDVDLSVQISDINLVASPSMQSYEWIDCATNSIIPGANNQVFSPVHSGNYSVHVVSPEGCEGISDCYFVQVVGIAQIDQLNWTVRPNPAKDVVYINMHNKLIDGAAVLLDVTGRKVSETMLQGEQTIIPLDQIANGTYLIQIFSRGNLVASKKLIVAN